MSRIGRQPINVPAGVNVSVDAENCVVSVKGPKGTLSYNYNKKITRHILWQIQQTSEKAE